VGASLLRLLPSAPGRRWLLVAIGATYLGLTYVPGLIAMAEGQAVTFGPTIILPATHLVAAGFATWAAVAAWLDRCDPRPFWALLAAALPITLAAQLLGALIWVGSVIWSPSVAETGPALALIGSFGALTACLALVAYVRYAPIADADLDPDRPMIGPFRRLTGR
jgi:hypothetical protein